MDERVHICNNPAIQHKLTLMRDAKASFRKFYQLVGEIAPLLAYEAMADLRTESVEVVTPLGPAKGVKICEEIVLVPVHRSGGGMEHSIRTLMPQVRVFDVCLKRDEQTLVAEWRMNNLPPSMSSKWRILVLDPMLATGGTMNAILDEMHARGARLVKLLCMFAAPEGIMKVLERHPYVRIFTAAVDERLNEKGYIDPGCGDAGDRQKGT